jgi:putative addiction module antidote
MELKVISVGNSLGVILPKEMVAKLGVQKGDSLYTTPIQDGVKLSVHDPDLETQLVVARELMKKWRNVLHELAK